MATPFNAERNILQGNTCGGFDVFLAVTYASRPKGAEPQLSPILGSPLFMITPLDVELPNSAL